MLNREFFNFYAIKELQLKTTETGDRRWISSLFVRDNSVDIPWTFPIFFLRVA